MESCENVHVDETIVVSVETQKTLPNCCQYLNEVRENVVRFSRRRGSEIDISLSFSSHKSFSLSKEHGISGAFEFLQIELVEWLSSRAPRSPHP